MLTNMVPPSVLLLLKFKRDIAGEHETDLVRAYAERKYGFQYIYICTVSLFLFHTHPRMYMYYLSPRYSKYFTVNVTTRP